MKLDEAIKHARDKSKVFRDFSHFEKDGYHYINLAEEQVQLAEWLEELKDYRRFNGAKTFDNGFKQGEKYGYNKAIDNVVKLLEELKEYKGLEEKELLLKLPCKVGSTIYQLINSYIYEYKVIGICFDIFQNKWMYEVAYEIGLEWFKTMCDFEDFGKTVFLTKEEAEKELKRLESAE